LRFVDEEGQNPADYILSMQPNDIYDDLEVRAVQEAGSYQEIIDTRKEIQSAFENGAQIILLASGTGEIIAISRASWYAYTKLGYKMFNSETIGIASDLLGNTLVRGGKASLLNNKNSFIRLGWSNIYKDNIGGGFILRIGIGAKKYHLDLPGTFIPNEISNPIVVFLQNFKI